MWYGNPKTHNAMKVVRTLKDGRVVMCGHYGADTKPYTPAELDALGWKPYQRKPVWARASRV